MGKFRLELDQLQVESFTTGWGGGLGTVRARDGASENPCASENETCRCTLNFAPAECESLNVCNGTGGTLVTCPEAQQTCAYGCTLGYACSGYCGTAEGTCAVMSCNVSQCVGGGNSECACAQSEIGSCYWQPTCNAQCPGHSGGWCTQFCTGDAASCVAAECGEPSAGGC